MGLVRGLEVALEALEDLAALRNQFAQMGREGPMRTLRSRSTLQVG